MDMQLLARKIILGVAGNSVVTKAATKYGLALGASRFVAGETVDDAIESIRSLNEKGISATLDHLGESVDDERSAKEAAASYSEILEKIAETKVDSNVSLKLTQMGLAISEELCYNNVRDIVAKAKELNNFVRIDMEDTPYTNATIRIFKNLYSEFDNVGLVIQSYLYRTEEDLEDLGSIGANIRLCKGAYSEPPELAFPNKKDVDENYKKVFSKYVESGNYMAAATHDENIINWIKEWAKANNISNDRFEFQMLYGIRPQLQEELAKEYKVRVYVPYGTEWYPYFTRRLAERPANLFFVLKNMLRK